MSLFTSPAARARFNRNVERNPVKVAIAKARIAQEMRKVQIELYLQVPGQDATLCLAHLGWILGMGCEVERLAQGVTRRLRLIHGALRHVHDMCMRGYRWREVNPLVFDAAVTLAHEAFMEAPHLAMHVLQGVEEFGQAIRKHAVRPDHVAGAEFYQDVERPA